MLKYCPHCGAPIRTSYQKYCYKCGYPLYKREYNLSNDRNHYYNHNIKNIKLIGIGVLIVFIIILVLGPVHSHYVRNERHQANIERQQRINKQQQQTNKYDYRIEQRDLHNDEQLNNIKSVINHNIKKSHQPIHMESFGTGAGENDISLYINDGKDDSEYKNITPSFIKSIWSKIYDNNDSNKNIGIVIHDSFDTVLAKGKATSSNLSINVNNIRKAHNG